MLKASVRWFGSRQHGVIEGRRDGYRRIPTSDWPTVRTPAERSLEALGNGAQAEIGLEFFRALKRKKFQPRDAEVHEELKLTQTAVDAAIKDNFAAGQQLGQLRDAMEPTSNSRFARSSFERCGYWLLAAALAVIEFPLNASTLQVLGLPRNETNLIAAGIGIAMVGSAHVLAQLLRRLQVVRDKRQAIVEIMLTAVGIGIGVAALTHISTIRTEYLSTAQRQLGLPIRLPVQTLAGILWIQVAITTLALIAAYLHSDMRAIELPKAAQTAKSARRKLTCAQRAHSRVEQQHAALHAERELVAWQYRERSGGSSRWYDFVRFVYRSSVLRHHPEGPGLELTRAEMPAIQPGAWVGQSLEPQPPHQRASLSPRPTPNGSGKIVRLFHPSTPDWNGDR